MTASLLSPSLAQERSSGKREKQCLDLMPRAGSLGGGVSGGVAPDKRESALRPGRALPVLRPFAL